MMTCPRRMTDFGPWDHKEDMDEWEVRVTGGPRHCSFCGSLHPDEFFAACEDCCKTGSMTRIDTTTKRGKFYVHGPVDAKFWNYHCTQEEWNTKVDVVKKAAQLSWDRMFPKDDGTLHVNDRQDA